MEKTVALLTDFSEASDEAFAHALALALAYKHHLYLLHVKDPGREPGWSSFPQVRETLARWGVIDADAAQSEVEAKLGIKVAKVEIESEDIPGGILDFTLKHPTNVIVMATRGREGLDRLLYMAPKLTRSFAALKYCQQFLSGLRRGVSLTKPMDKFDLSEFSFQSPITRHPSVRCEVLRTCSPHWAFHRRLFSSCMSAIANQRS